MASQSVMSKSLQSQLARCGMRSVKHSLGSGNHTIHSYLYDLNKKGLAVGWCMLSPRLLWHIVDFMIADEISIGANVLIFHERDRNLSDTRNVYLLLDNEAAWFTFKVYLNDAPVELTTNGARIVKPYLGHFRS